MQSFLRWHWLLLAAPLILLIQKSIIEINWANYVAIGLGPFFLFWALSFAHQSQNIGYRFQYPIILSFIFIFIISTKELNAKNKYLLIPPLSGILFGATIIFQDVKYLTNNDYINSFPQMLKTADFKLEKIAITEAGRFPFWYDSNEMIDLVGLNSIRVLNQGAAQVLDSSKPDLIFVHHAQRFDMSLFDSNKSFIITDATSLKIKSSYYGNNPVLTAPESALRFAAENGYLAVAVQYGSIDKNFSHVYFLSRQVNKNLFISILLKSQEIKIPYYQSLNNKLL